MARWLLAFVACLLGFAARGQDELRAPFIRTPDEVVERMLELANVDAQDLLIDLGSGDGRIVVAAARRFGARAIGVELDGRLVAASRENARAAGVADRVRFVQEDVLSADLSQATVVTVYLLPELMWKLQRRFFAELQPGTRIVSHSFAMVGWRPERVETLRVSSREAGQGATSTLYLWTVPADVRGSWRSGEERITIDQNYGEIEVDGAREPALRGRDISWRSPRGRFHGRVEGDRIDGWLEETSGARAVRFERVR